MNKYLGGEEQLKLIINYMEAVFFAKDINKLIEETLNFLAHNFKISNASIKIFEVKGRYYNNENIEKIYDLIEVLIEKQISDQKTPVYIKKLKEDVLTKDINEIDKIVQVFLAMPVLFNKECIGCIFLYSEEEIQEISNIVYLLSEKLGKFAITIHDYNKVQQSAITDALTGLYNRNYLTENLKNIIRKANEEKKPTSLIILDVDNFKKFNDTKGHLEGDKILKEMGIIINNNFNSGELCCRYGGEEFVIIMPETKQQDAFAKSENLRNDVEKSCELTISIGLMTSQNSSLNHSEMLQKADEALYKAKNSGKNKVVQYISIDKSLGTIDVKEAESIGKS